MRCEVKNSNPRPFIFKEVPTILVSKDKLFRRRTNVSPSKGNGRPLVSQGGFNAIQAAVSSKARYSRTIWAERNAGSQVVALPQYKHEIRAGASVCTGTVFPCVGVSHPFFIALYPFQLVNCPVSIHRFTVYRVLYVPSTVYHALSAIQHPLVTNCW
mmetsp:Transcript_14626/g.37357  ORF Transcript_14626/g.37357 Transcript_14626/m.37357 type:complete len:157 (-) Transcript_14626:130-600(-)